MIQIPDNLKPENFVIENSIGNENLPVNNKTSRNISKIFTIKEIKNLFLIEYRLLFKYDFIITKESNELFYTILLYFFENERFFNSPCLIIPKDNIPSFNKGLLIMGNTGVGKTSIHLGLEQVFKKNINFNPKIHFKPMTAGEVVNEYERINTPEEREDFFKKHQSGFRFYDDIKSEDDASNFGKVNIFKKILHLRNAKGSKTIITCNYNSSYPNDFEKGLDEFGIRYDERIYDRLFSDFNFIQASGKSFR